MSEETQFRVGNPGGPGRPLGSKNRLSEYFLHELAGHFEKYGKEAIERVCRDRPSEYLRIIAGLIPKELLLEVSQEEKTTWVISAKPKAFEQSSDDWLTEHGLDSPDRDAIEVETK